MMKDFNLEISNFLTANNINSAHNCCMEWLQACPQDANAHHMLGMSYAKQGNFAQAITCFQQAISYAPQQAMFYNNLSNALKKVGKLDQAITTMHEALRLAPNYAEGYNNLASLYYSQGRLDDAVPYYEKSLRLNPSYWEAHFNLANCWFKQDFIQQAITHYEHAQQLCPENLAIGQNLGIAYVVSKQFEKALPLLEVAVQANNVVAVKTNNLATKNINVTGNKIANAELQAQLAEVYLELGKTEQAIAQFEAAIAIDPNRTEWQHNLAILYLRHDEKPKAIKHFQQTLKLQPENDTARHMLAALSSQNSASAPATYVQDLFDQYAQFYNQHVKKNLDYQAPELLRSLLGKQLKLNKTLNILDIGCGTGLCSIYFKDLAHKLVGIDLSSNMLAIAKELKSYDLLCQGNISSTLPGHSQDFFDLIIAADVLVYCGKLDEIFANCWSTLKTGGYFAFTIEELPCQNEENQTKNKGQQLAFEEQRNLTKTLQLETKNQQKHPVANYTLTPTGRFAHTRNYIEKLAADHNFELMAYQPCELRRQQGEVITGATVLLQK